MSSLTWQDPAPEKPEYVKDMVNPWRAGSTNATNSPEVVAETERMVAYATANPTTWMLIGAAGMGRSAVPRKDVLQAQTLERHRQRYVFAANHAAPRLSRAAMMAMTNPSEIPGPVLDTTDRGFCWTEAELEEAVAEARILRAQQAATADLIVELG